MARPKTSQVVTLRIPFEDYLKIIENHGKIAPFLRDLIKISFKGNKTEKIENGIFITLPSELKEEWSKLPKNIQEEGLRAYIKKAIKTFK